MEEIENIKNELEEIKTARDDIKEALENEGETVTGDIRTYAEKIPNVYKVKTVNGVEADENKNVQIDASKINIDDEAEEKQTVKNVIESIKEDLENISSIPDYSVIETTVIEGYSKTYSLTKDGEEVGAKINIPKDLVINKGTVKVVSTENTPYDGASVGDKYLDIELNDPTKDHIYIPVKELVDIYTAGDGIEIDANNVISNKYTLKNITNKITSDKSAGYTYSFGYKCDDLMVFLNGEKLVGKENSTQTTDDYSYSKVMTGGKCTSITFTNDFTIVKDDVIELVLINPQSNS